VTRLYHGAYALRGERLTIDESRKLLGKPTPCVGREQELLALSAVLSTCIEESTPRVALVVAPAGWASRGCGMSLCGGRRLGQRRSRCCLVAAMP
jgi:hypothetical protein